ncbi:PP-loop family protein [Toxoplasma gondii FOU]|uniref:PP-loop family protein n=2 Tax=Toxoplasma gondii TaxID=5811 RepID=A0A086L8A1_TOXGO|nr:PP-loop family protein [Toxoplasma gondii FOU]
MSQKRETFPPVFSGGATARLPPSPAPLAGVSCLLVLPQALVFCLFHLMTSSDFLFFSSNASPPNGLRRSMSCRYRLSLHRSLGLFFLGVGFHFRASLALSSPGKPPPFPLLHGTPVSSPETTFNSLRRVSSSLPFPGVVFKRWPTEAGSPEDLRCLALPSLTLCATLVRRNGRFTVGVPSHLRPRTSLGASVPCKSRGSPIDSSAFVLYPQRKWHLHSLCFPASPLTPQQHASPQTLAASSLETQWWRNAPSAVQSLPPCGLKNGSGQPSGSKCKTFLMSAFDSFPFQSRRVLASQEAARWRQPHPSTSARDTPQKDGRENRHSFAGADFRGAAKRLNSDPPEETRIPVSTFSSLVSSPGRRPSRFQSKRWEDARGSERLGAARPSAYTRTSLPGPPSPLAPSLPRRVFSSPNLSDEVPFDPRQLPSLSSRPCSSDCRPDRFFLTSSSRRASSKWNRVVPRTSRGVGSAGTLYGSPESASPVSRHRSARSALPRLFKRLAGSSPGWGDSGGRQPGPHWRGPIESAGARGFDGMPLLGSSVADLPSRFFPSTSTALARESRAKRMQPRLSDLPTLEGHPRIRSTSPAPAFPAASAPSRRSPSPRSSSAPPSISCSSLGDSHQTRRRHSRRDFLDLPSRPMEPTETPRLPSVSLSARINQHKASRRSPSSSRLLPTPPSSSRAQSFSPFFQSLVSSSRPSSPRCFSSRSFASRSPSSRSSSSSSAASFTRSSALSRLAFFASRRSWLPQGRSPNAETRAREREPHMWSRDWGARQDTEEIPTPGEDFSRREKALRVAWKHLLHQLIQSRSAPGSPSSPSSSLVPSSSPSVAADRSEGLDAPPAFAELRDRTRLPSFPPTHDAAARWGARVSSQRALLSSLLCESGGDWRETGERPESSACRETRQDLQGDLENNSLLPSFSPATLRLAPLPSRSVSSPSPVPSTFCSSASGPAFPEAAAEGAQETPLCDPILETVEGTLLSSLSTVLRLLHPQLLQEADQRAAALLRSPHHRNHREESAAGTPCEPRPLERLPVGEPASEPHASPQSLSSASGGDVDRSCGHRVTQREAEGEIPQSAHEERETEAQEKQQEKAQSVSLKGEKDDDRVNCAGVGMAAARPTPSPAPPTETGSEKGDPASAWFSSDPPLFLLCCSGGSDSTALLHAFARLFSPRAVALRQACHQTQSSRLSRETATPGKRPPPLLPHSPTDAPKRRQVPDTNCESRPAIEMSSSSPSSSSSSSSSCLDRVPASMPSAFRSTSTGASCCASALSLAERRVSGERKGAVERGERETAGNAGVPLTLPRWLRTGVFSLPTHVVYFDHCQRPESAQREAASIQRLCKFYGFCFHRCTLRREPGEEELEGGRATTDGKEEDEAKAQLHAQKEGEEARERMREEEKVEDREKTAERAANRLEMPEAFGLEGGPDALGCADSGMSPVFSSLSSWRGSSVASSTPPDRVSSAFDDMSQSPSSLAPAKVAPAASNASFSWSFPLSASAGSQAPQQAWREWRRRAAVALLSFLSSSRFRGSRAPGKEHQTAQEAQTSSGGDEERSPEAKSLLQDGRRRAAETPRASPRLLSAAQCMHAERTPNGRLGLDSLFGSFMSPLLLSRLRRVEPTETDLPRAGGSDCRLALLASSRPPPASPVSPLARQAEKAHADTGQASATDCAPAGVVSGTVLGEEEAARSSGDIGETEKTEGEGSDGSWRHRDIAKREEKRVEGGEICKGEKGIREDIKKETERDTSPLAYVVMAHHAGDEMETLLMKLLRGAHITNLGGMSAVSGLSSQTPRFAVFRPFLSLQKAQLHRYLKALGGSWLEDETNALPEKYPRNAVRLTLLPLLASLLSAPPANPRSLSPSPQLCPSTLASAVSPFSLSASLSELSPHPSTSSDLPLPSASPCSSSASPSVASPSVASRSSRCLQVSPSAVEADASRGKAQGAVPRAGSLGISPVFREERGGEAARSRVPLSAPVWAEDCREVHSEGDALEDAEKAASVVSANERGQPSRERNDAQALLTRIAEAAASIFCKGSESTHALFRRASGLARQSAALRDWVDKEASNWEERVFGDTTSHGGAREEGDGKEGGDPTEGGGENEKRTEEGSKGREETLTTAEEGRVDATGRNMSATLGEESDEMAAGREEPAAKAEVMDVGEGGFASSGDWQEEQVDSQGKGRGGRGRTKTKPLPLDLWQKEASLFFQQELLHRWLKRASGGELTLSYTALETLTQALLSLRPSVKKTGKGLNEEDKRPPEKRGLGGSEGAGRESEGVEDEDRREAEQGKSEEARNEERAKAKENRGNGREEGSDSRGEEKRGEEKRGEATQKAEEPGEQEKAEREQEREQSEEDPKEGKEMATAASAQRASGTLSPLKEESQEGDSSARQGSRRRSCDEERSRTPEVIHRTNEKASEAKSKKTMGWQIHLPGRFTLKERGGLLFLVKGTAKG